jgi:hypothetical protein
VRLPAGARGRCPLRWSPIRPQPGKPDQRRPLCPTTLGATNSSPWARRSVSGDPQGPRGSHSPSEYQVAIGQRRGGPHHPLPRRRTRPATGSPLGAARSPAYHRLILRHSHKRPARVRARQPLGRASAARRLGSDGLGCGLCCSSGRSPAARTELLLAPAPAIPHSMRPGRSIPRAAGARESPSCSTARCCCPRDHRNTSRTRSRGSRSC